MKNLLVFVCLFSVFYAQAQTLTPKQLEISSIGGKEFEFGTSLNPYYLGFDNYNYYMMLEAKWGYSTHKNSILIMDKLLQYIEQYNIEIQEDEYYLTSIITDKNIIFYLLKYNSNLGQVLIIERQFSKQEETFSLDKILIGYMSKTNPCSDRYGSSFSKYFISISPDSNLTAMVFVIPNYLGNTESYYTVIINKNGEIIKKEKYNNDNENELLKEKQMVVLNNGDLFLGLTNFENKTNIIQNGMIRLVKISENKLEHYTIPMNDCFVNDMQLKVLKNENIYIGSLISANKDYYSMQFKSILFNPTHFDIISSNTKNLIPLKMEIYDYMAVLHKKFYYNLKIINIIEFENGDIIVNCEQVLDLLFTRDRSLEQLRGSILIIYLNNEAEITNMSEIIKKQRGAEMADFINNPKENFISFWTCNDGDRIGYLFNDNVNNYYSPKKQYDFDGTIYGYNTICIVANFQNYLSKPEIFPLTGDTSAYRYMRELLYMDNNKVIIFTISSDFTKAFIESVVYE